MPKKSSHSDPDRYTDPDLRDRIKAEITAGDKGGKPGQWSARKAQLVAAEYERAGGGFTHPPDEAQQSLQKWGGEHWHTADGEKAVREGETARYLPDKAWEELSPSEKAATDRKKREGSREGKQFVANTAPAAEARKHATAKKAPAKKAPAKKAPAKKASAKNAPAKKAPAKKAAAKKAPTATKEKPPGSKPAAKKSTAGKTKSRA